MDPNDDKLDLSTLDRGDALPDAGAAGDTDDTIAPGGEDTIAPAGDDTISPVGDDTIAPAGDDTIKPADDVVTPPVKKTDHMIPKSRLDEEVRKRRDLEKRLEALEAANKKPADDTPPPPPETVVGTDEWYDAQEEAYQNAVLEGETDKAKAIRRDIRIAERDAATAIADQKAQRAASHIDIEKEFNTVVNDLEEAFPVLNDKHDDYDPILTSSVLAAQAAILQRDPSKTPGAALREAAEKLGYKAAAPAGAEGDDDDAPPEKPALSVVPKKPAQPPRGGDSSEPQRSAGSGRLTEAAVAKMSDEDRARARGDIL